MYYVWACVYDININTVVSNSLNYTDSYEMNVGTGSIFNLFGFGVLTCWNLKDVTPRTILLCNHDEAHHKFHIFL